MEPIKNQKIYKGVAFNISVLSVYCIKCRGRKIDHYIKYKETGRVEYICNSCYLELDKDLFTALDCQTCQGSSVEGASWLCGLHFGELCKTF